mgnify:CR=1 FL=1
MSFVGKKLKQVWEDILQIDNSNTGVDSTTRVIKTGSGTSTSLQLGTQKTIIEPSADSTGTFVVKDVDGNAILTVDTTNNLVKAGVSQVSSSTQYAYFGVGSSIFANVSAGTHVGIPFMGFPHTSSTADNFELGTGTDPATSFTTAAGGNTDASIVISNVWYVPDNISIDEVVGIEGGDDATGDTTRMHLMSYDFTSGSTSCLTNGILLAHNSDVTNAGSEQAYKSTFTVDSANVSASKVIVATFRADTVNSDYSLNITVKYHNT